MLHCQVTHLCCVCRLLQQQLLLQLNWMKMFLVCWLLKTLTSFFEQEIGRKSCGETLQSLLVDWACRDRCMVNLAQNSEPSGCFVAIGSQKAILCVKTVWYTSCKNCKASLSI